MDGLNNMLEENNPYSYICKNLNIILLLKKY